ncbi:TIGR01244 family sulfur transferase [Methylocapsa palsarum]|uniref:TIGR01244 family protein n=1 Tax=Methylocapsa palsarum TaxID=1612308 RepID=A0A1I3Z875_9HYPH|nr:TIGR01244 family sulfur transferase [Methylocapsa palsarum]SFK40237.1 TIGR01244 family protein [Methylocapsa palsarum]
MVKQVGDRIFIAVAPKRGNRDIEEVAKGGMNLIINNRPDGESDDQMSSAEIEAAARSVGMDYVHIPVVPTQISDEQIAAMAEAIKQAGDGNILATCRTGMRSMIIFALAQAKIGVDHEELLKLAKTMGFDLIDHRERMVQLNKAHVAAQKAKAAG